MFIRWNISGSFKRALAQTQTTRNLVTAPFRPVQRFWQKLLKRATPVEWMSEVIQCFVIIVYEEWLSGLEHHRSFPEGRSCIPSKLWYQATRSQIPYFHNRSLFVPSILSIRGNNGSSHKVRICMSSILSRRGPLTLQGTEIAVPTRWQYRKWLFL